MGAQLSGISGIQTWSILALVVLGFALVAGLADGEPGSTVLVVRR